MVATYFAFFTFFIVVYFYVKIKNSNMINKIDNLSNFSMCFDNLVNECISALSEEDIINVKINKGKYYSFNQRSSIISIKGKEVYLLTDLFCTFHEIGHCIDFAKKRKKEYYVLYYMKITSIILYPIVLLWLTFSFINNDSFQTLAILTSIYIVVNIIKIAYIPFIEGRASKYAVSKITNYDIKFLHQLKKTSIHAATEQVFFTLSIVFPICLLAYLVYL